MILPIFISFNDFASQLRIDLPHLDLPVPPKEEEWIDWAQQVINNNNILNIPLPTELCYNHKEDWKKWAAYFINVVYSD